MSKQKVCEVKNSGFILDITLFSDCTTKDTQLDFLGSVIQISKPVARQLIKELKEHSHREILVPVIDKEYQLKISVDRVFDKYRIMDNERTVTLGYVADQTIHYFSGEA